MNSHGPLHGIRVIDMTTSYAGPTAAMYLADLGATVSRSSAPATATTRGCGGRRSSMVHRPGSRRRTGTRSRSSRRQDRRRARRSAPAARRRRRLPAEHESGEAATYGHRWNRAAQAQPSAGVLRRPGFGLDGPDSALPGYDLVAQARSGLMSVTGEKGRSPQRVSTALSDIVTGMSAVIAINAALVRQAATGLGEIVDVSC